MSMSLPLICPLRNLAFLAPRENEGTGVWTMPV